jgi:hypothetical protein
LQEGSSLTMTAAVQLFGWGDNQTSGASTTRGAPPELVTHPGSWLTLEPAAGATTHLNVYCSIAGSFPRDEDARKIHTVEELAGAVASFIRAECQDVNLSGAVVVFAEDSRVDGALTDTPPLVRPLKPIGEWITIRDVDDVPTAHRGRF